MLPLSFCQLYCFISLDLSTSSEQLFDWFVRSALSEEEKTSLRAGLITNFNEPVNQVSREKGEGNKHV